MSKKAHFKLGQEYRDKLFTPGYFGITAGMLCATAIFVPLAILLPSSSLIPHADIIFSAATFLFGVASAYYIANRHDRYSQLRANMAMESGGLMTLYHMALRVNDKFATAVRNAIEAYIVKTYQFEIDTYTIGSQTEYRQLVDVAKMVDPEIAECHGAAQNYLEGIINLNGIREQIYVLGLDRLNVYDWTMLSILSILILLSLFSLGFDRAVVRFVAVLLALTLVLVMLIIRDLDKLKRNEKLFIYGTYDRVLDEIGSPRFYLKKDITSRAINPDPSKEFRVID